jgi:beta-N-acetylhexosaminidase
MPLKRAVGQLLVSSFDGPRLPDYLRTRLRAGQTTGVILFGRNVGSAAELRALTADVQRAARGGALVAVDQEGGPVRVVPYVGPQPAQPAQSDPELTERLARDAGRGLRALGVNVTLAPVADVAAGPATVMSTRAFPGDSSAVSDLVAASVRGWRAGRVAPVVKHFPGFGSAARNTDDAPVTISRARRSVELDLRPFRAAIAARVPLVMAAHATYTAYDGDRIASQSPAVLTGLLRRRLGFGGAVTTDSIEAEAVLRRSSIAVAAERAIAAGADLVLMTGSASWNAIYPRLLRRARDSAAFRRRLGQAAGRVRALKRSLGLR